VRLISPVLKHVVYPCLANSGYLRWRGSGSGLSAITYHGVLPDEYEELDPHLDGSLVTAENFRRQLRLLKSLYNVVSPDQVRDWLVDGKDFPERAVLLTCDDGLRSALTGMAPILLQENLSCLFFVLGASAEETAQTLWYEELYTLLRQAAAGNYWFGNLEIRIELGDPEPSRNQRRAVWWTLVNHLSKYEHSERLKFIEAARIQFGLNAQPHRGLSSSESHRHRFSLLNKEQLRQLADLGMGIGAHTLSHPVLSRQSSETAWREISASLNLLQEALAQPIWALAYPFGDAGSVTEREIQMAEQAGYRCAFMNVNGGFGTQFSRFAIPRVHVTRDMTLSEFEAHVSGFHRDLRSRVLGSTA
jgi:peptidoglycan/xylan/chitin deacetylase (PgdA/CDA1 family)